MEEKKIRIGWTSEHCCIRVIKLSKALQETGKYEIHGLVNQVSWGTQFFNSLCFYHNKQQFRNSITRMVDQVDLFIHSNEPNWQLNVIKETFPDAKTILDAHDLDSVRQALIPLDEMRALTYCDGILFVSKGVKDFVCRLHEKQLKGKPTAVLEHYCNKEFFQKGLPPQDRRGLVYEGGAQSPPYKAPNFGYRHLYPIFKQLVDQGNELHLMFGNEDARITYSNLGAFTYSPQVYPDLMKKLLTKKWGLIAFNNPKSDQQQVNLTRTNKEQEYLACGLPVIVFGAPETARWVKEHEVGLCFEKLEDITPEVLDKEYDRVKKNVDELRPTLSMEQHIDILEKLITEVLR